MLHGYVYRRCQRRGMPPLNIYDYWVEKVGSLGNEAISILDKVTAFS